MVYRAIPVSNLEFCPVLVPETGTGDGDRAWARKDLLVLQVLA